MKICTCRYKYIYFFYFHFFYVTKWNIDIFFYDKYLIYSFYRLITLGDNLYNGMDCLDFDKARIHIYNWYIAEGRTQEGASLISGMTNACLSVWTLSLSYKEPLLTNSGHHGVVSLLFLSSLHRHRNPDLSIQIHLLNKESCDEQEENEERAE